MLELVDELVAGTATSGGGGSAPAVIEELNVTPSISSQTITAPGGVDGYSPVNVSAVTSSIDENIVASNIKNGVSILGVTGELAGVDTVTALNNTGTAVSEGDKVWINQEAVYSYNFDVVGTPTIDNTTEIVSGFSTSNYIVTPDAFDYTQPFQIYVKFTTPSSISYYSPLLGASAEYSTVPFYFMQNDFTLYGFGSSNGSSWNLFSNVAVKTCSANTTYTMMFEFTGSAYVWYEYENGTWTELTRVTSSTPCYSGGKIQLGAWGSIHTEAWTGSIDLSETKITANGSDLWVPSFTKLADYGIENLNSALLYEFSGTPKGSVIVSNNVMSNMAQSSYVEYTQSIDFSIPWEFNTCVYRNASDYAENRNAFIYSSVDSTDQSLTTAGFSLYCDTKINFISSGGSITSTAGSIQTNKTYYIKCGWTGTQYYIKQSEDGVTYTTVATADSTTPCVQTNTKINIGSSNWVNGFYWKGYIYLQDTFIVQNGQKVFSCCTNKNTLTGVAKENIASGSTGQVETVLPPAPASKKKRLISVADNTDNNKLVLYTDDGENWNTATMTNTRNWGYPFYGDGKFIVTCYGSNIFAYSTDGINWTEGTFPQDTGSSYLYRQGAYGNGIYLIGYRYLNGGPNRLYKSTNGIDWQLVKPFENMGTQSLTNLIFDGEKFVVMFNNEKSVRYSTDGETWTAGGTVPGYASDYAPTTFIYDSTHQLYVIAGSNLPSGTDHTTAQYIYVSSDLTTWSRLNVGSNAYTNVSPTASCIIGNKIKIFSGSSRISGSYQQAAGYIEISSDGSLATFVGSSVPRLNYQGGANVINGKAIVIGFNSDQYIYSTDGSTWTTGTLPASSGWWGSCVGEVDA